MWVVFVSLAFGRVFDSVGNDYESIEDALEARQFDLTVQSYHNDGDVRIPSGESVNIHVLANAILQLTAEEKPAIEVARGASLVIDGDGTSIVQGAALSYGYYGGYGSYGQVVCPNNFSVGPLRAVIVRHNATFEATNASFSCGAADDESFAGEGGVIMGAGGSNITLTNSTVEKGLANYGGGIGSWGELALDRTTVRNNVAVFGGGGVSMVGGTAFSARNSRFDNNRAGWGYYLDGSEAFASWQGEGGAARLEVGSAIFEQVAFKNNNSEVGGDIFAGYGSLELYGVSSCGAFANEGAFVSAPDANLTADGLLVVGNSGETAIHGQGHIDHWTLRGAGYAFQGDMQVSNSVLDTTLGSSPDNTGTVDFSLEGVGGNVWLRDSELVDLFCGVETRVLPGGLAGGPILRSLSEDWGAWGAGRVVGERNPLVDFDGDGAPWAADCHDSDRGRSGWAVEDCRNEVDDNCDGVASTGPNEPYTIDLDGDGFTGVAWTCEPPSDEQPETAMDCDDYNPDIGAATPQVFDGDEDGFSVLLMSCDPGNAGTDSVAGDCDDTNPAVHSPVVSYVDVDGDGWVGVGPAICVPDGVEPPADGRFDCDDEDETRFPDAEDIPGDGIDQNCSGQDAEAWVRGCSTTGGPVGWLALVGISAGLARRRGVTSHL